MGNYYDKVENKVKQVTAHCPKCLSMNYQSDYRINVWRCMNCDWIGDYEDLAFMKMRSSKPVPMRNNNPNYYTNKKTKYGGKSDGLIK